MTTKEKKQQMTCAVKGRVQKNAVLRAGMISGDLAPHPEIKTIKPCVKKCCQDMKCEVAVMLEDKCYTVRCINKEYCQSRPAPPSAYSKKPMLAFVKRENLYKGKNILFLRRRPKFAEQNNFHYESSCACLNSVMTCLLWVTR